MNSINKIYWEKQNKFSQLCALHTVNSLLQGPYFTREYLEAIANKLDQLEKNLLGEAYECSNNMDSKGNFNITVIEAALQEKSLQLLPIKFSDPKFNENLEKTTAIIFHSSRHWFCARKIESTWYNLNSSNKAPGPQIISLTYFNEFIKTTENYGFISFFVNGQFPHNDFSSEMYQKLNPESQFLVDVKEIQKSYELEPNRKFNIEEEDEEELDSILKMSENEYQEKVGLQGESKNIESEIEIIKRDLSEKQEKPYVVFYDGEKEGGFSQAVEDSKKEYFKNLEISIPKEPNLNEESFAIKLIRWNEEEHYYKRTFSPDNNLQDIINFGKVKFRINNPEIVLVKQKDGSLLFDPSIKLSESGLDKLEVLYLKTYEEAFD